MSQTLVPNIVAKNTTTETPAVEDVGRVDVLQLVDHHAWSAHANRMPVVGRSEREDATSWREGYPSAFRSATYRIEHEVKGQTQ